MKYILIVDDSATIRMSIELVVKDTGLETVQATNGEEALVKIKDIRDSGNDIAICIVDVNMPVMDGITFLSEFRKTDKFTPVIILTTESSDEMIQSGMKAGASGWAVKPFNVDQFREVVNKFIK